MYSKDHLTDGFVPDDALPLIGMGIPKLTALVSKMVEKDLWVRVDGGYTVTLRRWEKHQTTKEKVEENREAARIRKENERNRKKAARDNKPKLEDVTAMSQRDMSHGHGSVTSLSEPEPEPINNPTDYIGAKAPKQKRPSIVFVPPTKEEVAAEFKSRGLPMTEARMFYAHHDTRDWFLSKGKKMVRWRSAVDTWQGNYEKGVFSPTPNGSSNHHKPTPKEDLEALAAETAKG
jgi:hypothetical protein